MKKLVVQQVSKIVDTSGNENIIETNEFNNKIENIETKEMLCDANDISLTITEATFLTKVDNQDGSYVFEYSQSNEGWYLGENSVDLSEYGIELENSPFDKDRIVIEVADSAIEISEYLVATKLITDHFCSYLDFYSDLPVQIEITNGDNIIFSQQTAKKVQLWTFNQNFTVVFWHNNTTDFNVKIITALNIKGI